MKLKPLGTQILVKFLPPPAPKPGDFYIPNADIGPARAVIVAQGSGRNALGKIVPFETKVGDKVFVSQHIEGTELKEGGEVYGVMTEDSLLGLIEDSS